MIRFDNAAPLAQQSPAPFTLPRFDLICFSHLRWDFVWQRPQHLMSRFARDRRVIFWEEPVAAEVAELDVRLCERSGVLVATPRLPADQISDEQMLSRMLDDFLADRQAPLLAWYYTPMMLPFSRHLETVATVYDCMDELANFRFAPPELISLESELLDRADLVFTGGLSLYEAKKDRHPAVHAFPSSVDRAHFMQARQPQPQPADQEAIKGPRLGYYGVVDERMDLELLAAVADARPEWSLILVGPVVKVDPADLPQRPNLHYLGAKRYEELPSYLAGWDAALMPFAINDATRFISPTKTPEYLAGGRPVVSTPITDVARHYGDVPGVFIAAGAEPFIYACEQALALPDEGDWRDRVDLRLACSSWDMTHGQMASLLAAHLTPPPTAPALLRDGKLRYDYAIVGAGFAGSVLAERLASQHGASILLVDRRPHIAGNAYDHHDSAGILVHKYGPHIFHTNSDEIVDYLSQFTSWRPYEHRVLAQVRGQLVPIPINRDTLNRLFQLDLKSDGEAARFLASRAEPVADIRTSEDVVISAIGRELYELFFRGYTRKQWGIDPSALDRAVTARIPTRTNTDDRYFGDKHQLMPADGYTAMFQRMLDHPAIDRLLGTDWEDIKDSIDAAHIIYTGPIDEFFGFRFGKLPYRSLRFEHRTLEQELFQPVAVVNYPDESVPYTRITEYKHLTGQTHRGTSITYEYPAAHGDPYYPIPRPENQTLYKRYEALADATPGVTFVGRLATYRYYNMDQVVGQALSAFRKLDRARAVAPATTDILQAAE